MKISAAWAFVAIIGLTSAFGLGWLFRPDPPVGDAEQAYRLERAATREVMRARLLTDAAKYRELAAMQCIPADAIPVIVKWADKCVIDDCSIDVGGKPFVGIAKPPKAPPKAPAAKTASTTPARSEPVAKQIAKP